jgi:hypothetical protein
MANFNEAAVIRWLRSVPGLTAAQRAGAATAMSEDEYDGKELVAATTKNLARLLKGGAAEAAVPLLLAARDACMAAELKEVAAPEGPSCSICMEPYSAAAAVVPRVLRCGHEFCEACLDKMLEPEPPARKRRKRLECPSCRKECTFRSGRAAELPIVYALQGA